MKAALEIIALLFLASLRSVAAANACPAPPIATADAAICLAELHMATAPARAYALKYQAKDHESYWLVAYWPKDSNMRGGGGKLKIEKATGRVVFVEGYR